MELKFCLFLLFFANILVSIQSAECESDSEVLNCTLCELTVIPSAWENNYTLVDLSRNDISTITVFPFSESIQEIILCHNNITEIVNRAFSELINIKIINLSFNYLTYSSLNAISFQGKDSTVDYEPIYVEDLKLSHNAIHALGPKVFEHMPNLTELYLDHNPLNVLDSVTIVAITNAKKNLKVLDLSFCGLDALPEGFLHSLSNLETLVLEGNQFVNIPGTLSEATALKFLSLNDNPLSDLVFPEIRELEVLEVSEIDTVYTISNGSFKYLPALKILRCNQNTILREIQENIFSEQQNVTEVELRGNALTRLPEVLGVPWEQLLELDLRDNPWECDCHLFWMTSRLVPAIVRRSPLHADNLRCGSPATVAGVPLVQMPLHACREAGTATRRVTALLAILALLVASGTVLLAGQWARRSRRVALPLADASEQEDVVHYVRIYNPKD